MALPVAKRRRPRARLARCDSSAWRHRADSSLPRHHQDVGAEVAKAGGTSGELVSDAGQVERKEEVVVARLVIGDRALFDVESLAVEQRGDGRRVAVVIERRKTADLDGVGMKKIH